MLFRDHLLLLELCHDSPFHTLHDILVKSMGLYLSMSFHRPLPFYINRITAVFQFDAITHYVLTVLCSGSITDISACPPSFRISAVTLSVPEALLFGICFRAPEMLLCLSNGSSMAIIIWLLRGYFHVYELGPVAQLGSNDLQLMLLVHS